MRLLSYPFQLQKSEYLDILPPHRHQSPPAPAGGRTAEPRARSSITWNLETKVYSMINVRGFQNLGSIFPTLLGSFLKVNYEFEKRV